MSQIVTCNEIRIGGHLLLISNCCMRMRISTWLYRYVHLQNIANLAEIWENAPKEVDTFAFFRKWFDAYKVSHLAWDRISDSSTLVRVVTIWPPSISVLYTQITVLAELQCFENWQPVNVLLHPVMRESFAIQKPFWWHLLLLLLF